MGQFPLCLVQCDQHQSLQFHPFQKMKLGQSNKKDKEKNPKPTNLKISFCLADLREKIESESVRKHPVLVTH